MARAPDAKKLREDEARVVARAKAKAFNDYEMKIHIGDVVHPFRAGAVTMRHTAMLREASGSEQVDPVFVLILGVSEESCPPDYVAKLVWLARLQAGERVSLDEVLDGISFADELWVDFPEGAPDPGTPGVVFPDPPTPSDG